MGFWGCRLYDNDITCDLRGTYESLLFETKEENEIVPKYFEKSKDLVGEGEEPLAWYVLADMMHKYGRLTEEVKQQTLYWIEQKGGLEIYLDDLDGSDSKNADKWLNTLNKLKNRILSPMKKPKKINRDPFIPNPWNIGDCFVYKFRTNDAKKYGVYGKYIVLQKIGDIKIFKKNSPETIDTIKTAYVIYNKIFDFIPSLSDLENVELLVFNRGVFETGESMLKYRGEQYKRKFNNCDELNYFPFYRTFSIENYEASNKFKAFEKKLLYIGNKEVTKRELTYSFYLNDWMISFGFEINLRYFFDKRNLEERPFKIYS